MNEDGEIGDGRLGLTMGEDQMRHLLDRLNGNLFEDPEFPADATSLFYSKRSKAELEQV